MRVHLVKKQTIENFVSKNARSRVSFNSWTAVLKLADWVELSEIVGTFNSADILGRSSDRVVFNIGGNNYRMICTYHFGIKKIHLFVNWLGTHAQYEKVCNKGEQYTISKY